MNIPKNVRLFKNRYEEFLKGDKFTMKLKIFLVVVLLGYSVLMIPAFCFSDTLFLKDGRTIESETIWQDGSYYKYTMYGATVGISEEKVEKVQYSKSNKNTFQFDVWEFGITVQKSFDLAEQHNIPLHKSGMITINKQYHPQVRKYYAASHFYYKTNLLGHFAQVDLFFSPISQKLHTVSIKWLNQKTKDSALVNEIISMISEKYGVYEKQNKKLFGKTTAWITKEANRILLNIHSTVINLNYLHTELRQLDYEEKEILKAQKIEKGLNKDKNKF